MGNFVEISSIKGKSLGHKRNQHHWLVFADEMTSNSLILSF